MKNVWKLLLCLAVALPMVTYVAGALSATRQEAPQPETIVLRPTNASPSDSATSPKGARPRHTLEIKPKPEVIERSASDTAEDDSFEGDGAQQSDSSGSGSENGSTGDDDNQPNGSDTDSEDRNPDEDSDKDDDEDDDSDKDDDDAESDEDEGPDKPDESDSSN